MTRRLGIIIAALVLVIAVLYIEKTMYRDSPVESLDGSFDSFMAEMHDRFEENMKSCLTSKLDYDCLTKNYYEYFDSNIQKMNNDSTSPKERVNALSSMHQIENSLRMAGNVETRVFNHVLELKMQFPDSDDISAYLTFLHLFAKQPGKAREEALNCLKLNSKNSYCSQFLNHPIYLCDEERILEEISLTISTSPSVSDSSIILKANDFRSIFFDGENGEIVLAIDPREELVNKLEDATRDNKGNYLVLLYKRTPIGAILIESPLVGTALSVPLNDYSASVKMICQ